MIDRDGVKELRVMQNALCDVLAFGRKKYNMPLHRSMEMLGGKEKAIHDRLGACLRHLEKMSDDINALDEESGLPHAHHAFTNIGIITFMLQCD